MPDTRSDQSHRTLTRGEQLAMVADEIAAAPWVALDSESNSMFVYQERVCLVQINANAGLVLVDPLTEPEAMPNLEPLRAVLEDPNHRIWLHGGEYDVAVFKREYDISLRGVFDTQQAASFLGWPKTSYAAVVEQVLGVRLSKAYRDYDWGTRPLDPRAVDYALDDVRHLPDVAAALVDAVHDADLVEEVEIANEAVMDALPHDNAFGPDHVYRVKGQHELDPGQRARLQALLVWRDAFAREVDRPPGRLINDRALVATVRADPRTTKEVSRLRLGGRVMRRADELLDALSDARERELTTPPRSSTPRPDPATRSRGEKLRQWRRREAERRKVPLQVVLPARAMEVLAVDGAGNLDTVPQLGPKRVAMYGDTLRKLCHH